MESSILIQNLKCGGCANTIVNQLSTLKNVFNLDVNINNSLVSFSYINQEDVLKVKKRLKELGYPAIEDSNSFSAKAKSFFSCAKGKLTQ